VAPFGLRRLSQLGGSLGVTQSFAVLGCDAVRRVAVL